MWTPSWKINSQPYCGCIVTLHVVQIKVLESGPVYTLLDIQYHLDTLSTDFLTYWSLQWKITTNITDLTQSEYEEHDYITTSRVVTIQPPTRGQMFNRCEALAGIRCMLNQGQTITGGLGFLTARRMPASHPVFEATDRP